MLPCDSWGTPPSSSSLGKDEEKAHMTEMVEKPPAAAPAKPPSPPSGAPRSATPREIGGPTGPEPTRYGDWERNGRCTDF